MTNYTNKKKSLTALQAITLMLTVTLFSPTVMALDLTIGASYVSKELTKKAWDPVDNQKGFGVEVTFIPPILPFIEVIGGIISQDSSFKIETTSATLKSRDTYVGVGAGYTFLGLVRPSVSAGVISSNTEFKAKLESGDSEKTSDSNSGLWYGLSVRAHFLSSFFVQYRLLNTTIDSDRFGDDADLNSRMNILTFGYSFL